MYLAGLRSPLLSVADTAHPHRRQRPSGRSATRSGRSRSTARRRCCYVNVNDLLGFEIGDIKTGKKLAPRRGRRATRRARSNRHGCPSHGIGLTPDETELWLADGHNKVVHVFDNTVMPPKQIASHRRSATSRAGSRSASTARYAYPSTGEVFDVKTRARIAAWSDETGRQVGSEKLVEVVTDGTKPIRAGDQFGVGARK